MVVEEEDNLRALLRDILAGKGFAVIDAGTGQIAIELAEGHRGTIDLLITDLILRGMSGVDVSREVARGNPALKTLYLEDHSPSTMISRGIPLTGLEYLAKPVKLKALVAKVYELLEMTGDDEGSAHR
jgi:DNA-binding response OmpR family regulator